MKSMRDLGALTMYPSLNNDSEREKIMRSNGYLIKKVKISQLKALQDFWYTPSKILRLFWQQYFAIWITIIWRKAFSFFHITHFLCKLKISYNTGSIGFLNMQNVWLFSHACNTVCYYLFFKIYVGSVFYKICKNSHFHDF